MKFIYSLASVVVICQLVSAQSPTCAAQEILNTCLSNQDIYLKTCTDQDYACLCKWHSSKLSCFDNCPQDMGRPFVQGSKDTFCSIAKTYNTTSSSLAISPSTSAAASVVAAASQMPVVSSSVAVVAAATASNKAMMPSHSATTHTTSTSMATSYQVGQGILLMAAGISTWFLT